MNPSTHPRQPFPASISIVMPNWNGMPFLRESVESVLSQTDPDWELIIGDNGSTDDSLEYLFSLQDDRIRIFHHKENLGIYGNLNFLFEKANYAIIQLLCADDYLLPGALETVRAAWQESPPETSFIRHNWPAADGPDRKSKGYPSTILKTIQHPEDTTFLFFLFGNFGGSLSNVSFNKTYFDAGMRCRTDLPYGGDYEFWSRVCARGPWRLATNEISHIRKHPGQASNYLNQQGELVAESTEILMIFWEQLKNHYPPHLLRLNSSLISFRFITQAVKMRNFAVWKSTLSALNFPCYFSSPVIIIFYLLSLGGRIFQRVSADLLVAKNPRVLRKISLSSEG